LLLTKQASNLFMNSLPTGYLNFLYPSLSLIELQKFLESFKKFINNFSKGYIYLRFFSKMKIKSMKPLPLLKLATSLLKLLSKLTKTNVSILKRLTNHGINIRDKLVP